MEEIDYLFEEFFSDLKFYSTIDGDTITTDLVNLYDKLNELLNSLIRKLSLSSSDGKLFQYINVCISNIENLDFFKCEEYINAIKYYDQHIFKDKSLADAMLEIRLAKGEIDYNIFPYIISKLHRLDFYTAHIDDDEKTIKVINDYWYLQIYICHYFATKAINELNALSSFPSDKKEKNNIIDKKKRLQFRIAPVGIQRICDEMVNSEFVDEKSSKLFVKFLKQEDFDQNKKINWQSNPTTLYSLIKILKKEKIIHFPKWKVLNDYFIAKNEDNNKTYDFTKAGTNLKMAVNEDEINKIKSIVDLFRVYKPTKQQALHN